MGLIDASAPPQHSKLTDPSKRSCHPARIPQTRQQAAGSCRSLGRYQAGEADAQRSTDLGTSLEERSADRLFVSVIGHVSNESWKTSSTYDAIRLETRMLPTPIALHDLSERSPYLEGQVY